MTQADPGNAWQKGKRPSGATLRRFLRRCFRCGESFTLRYGRRVVKSGCTHFRHRKPEARLRTFAPLVTPPGLAMRENGGVS
nr:MAG TPA_asm: hypothetical protein [Bacteriophage sp.]DAX95341.1 MAG TPA: hypothetical protein [Caudoviricetes sp.]